VIKPGKGTTDYGSNTWTIGAWSISFCLALVVPSTRAGTKLRLETDEDVDLADRYVMKSILDCHQFSQIFWMCMCLINLRLYRSKAT
jgi:hypothetical protein